MGKVHTNDNPNASKAVRFSNKRKEAQLLLDNTGDVQILVDKKNVFSNNAIQGSINGIQGSINNIQNSTTNNTARIVSLETQNTHSTPSFNNLNKGLEYIKPSIIRNKENDLTLSSESGVSRVETRMVVQDVYYDSNYEAYVVELLNVPYCEDLITSPNKWGLITYTSGENGVDSLVRIANVLYYDGFDKLLTILLVQGAAQPTIGDYAMLYSFLRNNININYGPAFPNKHTYNNANPTGGMNNISQTSSVCAIIPDTNTGENYAIVTSTYIQLSPQDVKIPNYGNANIMYTLWRTDAEDLGADNIWELVSTDSPDSSCFRHDIIPENTMIGNVGGAIKLPTTDNYCVPVGLYRTWATGDMGSNAGHYYGYCSSLGIITFAIGEDYDGYGSVWDQIYKPITFEAGSFTNKISGQGYGLSLQYYKGYYYLSIHDGGSTPASNPAGVAAYGPPGTRKVFKSKYPEGPYKVDSIIFDLANDEDIKYNHMSFSAANGALFVYNEALYYFCSASSNDPNWGSTANFHYNLFKYNDTDTINTDNTYNYRKWSLVSAGLFGAFYGAKGTPYSYGYPPNATDAWPEFDTANYNLSWGWDHLGVVSPQYVTEDGKLVLGYVATGGRYTATVATIDLKTLFA